ncbi:MAG: hypothetical protein FWE37_05560 [Spirochaetaceae bacterium]|nr:hypothetical protein [Spirochaetaceae bacterium]
MYINSALFMQARLNSDRLPQKALKPLAGKASLLLAMQGLYGCADTHLLLTCSNSEAAFSPLAREAGYGLFIGDENDVLGRYAKAVSLYLPQWVIRATGDNTLVPKALVSRLLTLTVQANADYGRFSDTPHGSGVEVIRAEALLVANNEAVTAYQREHVCPFLYDNPARFKILLPLAPAEWRYPHLRTTLDTPEDYNRLSQFFTTKATLEEYILWST